MYGLYLLYNSRERKKIKENTTTKTTRKFNYNNIRAVQSDGKSVDLHTLRGFLFKK